MEKNKGLLTRLGETLDQYRVDRRAAAQEPTPVRGRRWLPWLGKQMIPNIGTLLLVVVLLLTVPSLAAPRNAPQATSTSTISYQGRLADSSGNPLTGYYNLEFRIYDVPTGGTPLWEEFWTGGNSVQVSDGLFNVMLGSIDNTLASAIEGHDELYLGITVGADSEMTPRVQLGSVPFAMYAASANVPDGSITTEKIADGAVTTPKIADDAVNAEKIDGGSVWGASGTTLLNFIPMPSKGDPVLDLQGIGSFAYTDLDLTDATSSSAVAVLLQVGLKDAQSLTHNVTTHIRKKGEVSPCAVVKGKRTPKVVPVGGVLCVRLWPGQSGCLQESTPTRMERRDKPERQPVPLASPLGSATIIDQ